MFTDCDPVNGFHELESDALGNFAWIKASFETRLRRAGRFAMLAAPGGDDAPHLPLVPLENLTAGPRTSNAPS